MHTENGTYTLLLLGWLRSSYEKDPESGLYYAGARYQVPRLGSFNSTDPLWWKSPDKTSYHYCANNPVRFVDPDGRDFDPASEKIAKATEKAIKARIKELSADNNNGDIISELQNSLDDIDKMRNDRSTIYSYKTTNSKEAIENSINGPTTEIVGNNRKGQDQVHLYYDSQSTIIHEGRHGGDIARGILNKDKSNYGVSHEISAYKAQYAFDGYIDYRPNLSKEQIDLLGENINKYFIRYNGGIKGINKDFIKGIVEYYKNGTKPIPLYGRTPDFYNR